MALTIDAPVGRETVYDSSNLFLASAMNQLRQLYNRHAVGRSGWHRPRIHVAVNKI